MGDTIIKNRTIGMSETIISKNDQNSFLHSVSFRFRLKLNVDTWGKYKKGDEDDFIIKLIDDSNGLTRYPIDKRWDIVSCELVNES